MPAEWLEPDDEFEGVGAHRHNFRYDPVDEPDEAEPAGATPRPQRTAVAPQRSAVGVYRLDGHDGSHHQYDAGPVDLDALAAATWIIWWKATQSISYTDPTFTKVWRQRQKFTHRFPYHWLSSTTDPQQQAAHYLSVVGPNGVGDGDMLDAEEAGITVAGCLGWVEAIEAVRKRPVEIYTGLYVSGGSIWKSDALREGKYGLRAFHVAAYVTEENLNSRMNALGLIPKYPKHGWQWSSNGPVPGITGRADMNRIEDHAIYDTVCGRSAPTPIPTDPGGSDDMDIFGNSQTGKYGSIAWPNGGCSLFRLLEDGSYRPLTFGEWVAGGQKMGNGCDDATIDSLPVHVTPTPGGVTPAPTKLKVVSQVTSTVEPA